jgi:hypothetical protein
MNIITLAMITLAAMDADASAAQTEQKIVVCIQGGAGLPLNLVPLAQKFSSRMFAQIGVPLDWRYGLRACPGEAIVISLSLNTPESLLPGALAYARPYEHSHIVIFCDRVGHTVPAGTVPALLAHVMAHEITHMLQNTDRHSDKGVMKRRWSAPDYEQMADGPLSFTEDDVHLIRRGLQAQAVAGSRGIVVSPGRIR